MNGRLSGRVWLPLAVILFMALASRLGYVFVKGSPPVAQDSLHYHDIADNLASGEGFSLSYEHLLEGDRPADGGPAPTARRPPLYPVFLAGIFRLFGHNYRLVQVLQAVMGTFTVLLIYWLAVAALGRRDAALVAAGVSAVYPFFIVFTRYLLTEVTFLLLAAGAFLATYRCLERGGAGASIAAGFLGGLSALCRPTAVFFIILHTGLVLAFRSRSGGGRAIRVELPAYVLAFCLTMAPWVARNYAVFNAFIPGFTSAGYNLFMGTYPPSRGLANISPSEHPPELRRELEGAGEIQTDRVFRRAALENLRRYPFEYLKLVAMKTIRGWLVIKKGHDWTPTPLSAAAHVPLLALAAAGALALARRRPMGVALLVSGLVSFTLFHALVVSNLRYNLPAVPFAIILASAPLASIVGGLRRKLSPS